MHHNYYVKYISTVALFSVIAAICGILEGMLPLQLIIPVPGVKLGIANIIIILVTHIYGLKTAFSVVLIRILIVFLFAGNPVSLLISLCGGLLSLLTLGFLYKTYGTMFSFIGISSACAASHGIGQLFVAYFIVGKPVLYYLPVLIFACTLTGIFTGILLNSIIKITDKNR